MVSGIIVTDAKRPSERDAHGGGDKRAKTGAAPPPPSSDHVAYEITLGGECFVDINRLFAEPTLAAYFNRTYNRSVRNLIREASLTVVYVRRAHIAQGVYAPKASFSTKSDSRLVRRDDILDILAAAQNAAHALAPPVLVDDDLAFVDASGVVHSVEMRGERTEDGIFFKVKDIGTVFGTVHLADDLQLARRKAQEGRDYLWFTIPTNERKLNGASRELFFTHRGMVAEVYQSKSPVAERFQEWVSRTVFVHKFGTAHHKKELAKSLLTKKAVDELTRRCVNPIACVYLLETSIKPEELDQDDAGKKKVYKFGYSRNLKDRMDKHAYAFGRDCVIDTLMLIPADYASTAETKLKHLLGQTYLYKHGSATELLLLSETTHKIVQETMRTVAETFYGTTTVHVHALEKMEHENQLLGEKLKNDRLEEASKLKQAHLIETSRLREELIIARKDVELAKKDVELAKKEAELVPLLKSRIQSLEDTLRRYSNSDTSAA